MPKTALITGITGQDGSYLAELLLEKGYAVHGIVRRTSTDNTRRIRHLDGRLKLHTGEMTDGCSLEKAVREAMPDEVYNLAAQSHVRVSFEAPHYTREVNFGGTDKLAAAAFSVNQKIRFYQASTSEMFGDAREVPQNENTPLNPISPYAKAKAEAHERVVLYLRGKGFYICSGILFNHESERRGDDFVTQKIVKGAVAIKKHREEKLILGNLDAKRDWGYAPEYVEAMWMMLQQERPEDFVIGTGETHSVKDFAEKVFGYLNIRDWERHVEINGDLRRPNEVNLLQADAKKAKRVLGWGPKTKFEGLVKIMVDAERALYPD